MMRIWDHLTLALMVGGEGREMLSEKSLWRTLERSRRVSWRLAAVTRCPAMTTRLLLAVHLMAVMLTW